jgi:hypothetical protein
MSDNEKPTEAKPQGIKLVHSEETLRQQKPQLWKPGQSGNPAGRPKGSRNRLSELVFEKLLARLEGPDGDAMLDRIMQDEPAKLLAAIVALVPKQVDTDIDVKVRVTSSVDSLMTRLDALAKRDREYEADRERAVKTIEHNADEASPVKRLLLDKLGEKA